jgi:tetratricopeptide (TPR) repeat protein
VNRGNRYRNNGEYDRAIQDYDEAIRLALQFEEAFNNRGVTYGEKGEYDRAIRDYDQAIRLDPNLVKAFLN